jgi:hypothetical protein
MEAITEGKKYHINTLDGTLVRNRQDIANEFNKYFLSIAKNIIIDQNYITFISKMIILPCIIYYSLSQLLSQI